jgi:hypothetical protein
VAFGAEGAPRIKENTMNHVTRRLIVGVVTAAVGSLAAAAAVASPAAAGAIVNDLRNGPTAADYPPGPTAADFPPGPTAARTHADQALRAEGVRWAIIPCL